MERCSFSCLVPAGEKEKLEKQLARLTDVVSTHGCCFYISSKGEESPLEGYKNVQVDMIFDDHFFANTRRRGGYTKEMDASMEELLRMRANGASIEQILEKANISRGTYYRRLSEYRKKKALEG